METVTSTSREKCWQIEEHLPVSCTKRPAGNGSWSAWKILIPPMTMTYDKFTDIATSIHGGMMEQYNYIDGSAMLIVNNEGLKELEAMIEVISIN